jgi:hypothetical protein
MITPPATPARIATPSIAWRYRNWIEAGQVVETHNAPIRSVRCTEAAASLGGEELKP